MKELAGRIAVVTGGGSGMGRELVRQLVAADCNIAMCDVSAEGMAETQRLCAAAGLPQGLRVTAHLADVSDGSQVERFCDEVGHRHDTDKIHLLFNNAGIGGGSIIAHGRDEWERTFNVCWGGVYNWCRSCSSGAGTTRICTSFPPSSYARSSGTARVHALEAGHWRQIDAAEETARIMLGS